VESKKLGAFFASQKTGLSVSIGLFRNPRVSKQPYFHFNPSRAQGLTAILLSQNRGVSHRPGNRAQRACLYFRPHGPAQVKHMAYNHADRL
jgi:hypothetical protein